MDNINEFASESIEPVEGIAYLGALETDVEFCGHTFGLRTLRANEEIAAAKAIEDFRGTIKEADAWMAVQVGIALTHIDDDESFCPQAGPNILAFAKARINYVTSQWYWPTIDFLYQTFAALQEKQIEAFRTAQDLLPKAPTGYTPLANSSEQQGILNEETSSVTLS